MFCIDNKSSTSLHHFIPFTAIAFGLRYIYNEIFICKRCHTWVETVFILRRPYLLTLLNSLLTYLLTPCSRVLLEKLTGSQLVKKFPEFYGTRRFITAFTSARHLSLSYVSSIQFIPPHPTSRRSILILYSHLCLGLPTGLFPPGFPTKTLHTPLPSPIRATCPAHYVSKFNYFYNRNNFPPKFQQHGTSYIPTLAAVEKIQVVKMLERPYI